ncbi:hypothetical protein ACP4OV_002160 [Aristida adscensionis]
MNSAAMDQIGKYWGGLWGARRSGTTASPTPAWAAAAAACGGEPSWEEQAFARDAAAHLGGCVWPPRSYSCSFCQREFRSAQALGGHMNVHRRDRALLRQGSSPDDDDDDGHQEAPRDDQPQQQGLSFLFRAASNPSTTTASTSIVVPAAASKGQVITTTLPPSYLSTVIKESKNSIFMSIPAPVAARLEAIDQCCDREDDAESGRMVKRRRLDPPMVALPIFVQPAAAATEVAVSESKGLGGVDHEAIKVPKTIIISCPNSSSPLEDRQEVDLELRLGSTPKVT